MRSRRRNSPWPNVDNGEVAATSGGSTGCVLTAPSSSCRSTTSAARRRTPPAATTPGPLERRIGRAVGTSASSGPHDRRAQLREDRSHRRESALYTPIQVPDAGTSIDERIASTAALSWRHDIHGWSGLEVLECRHAEALKAASDCRSCGAVARALLGGRDEPDAEQRVINAPR